MNSRLALIIAVLLSAASTQATASTLFESSAVLNIELTGPLHELQSDKNSSVEMPFTLRANGNEHVIDVRLRGNSRRRVCSFPPMRLSFEKELSANTVFENQKHLKLVTHCRDSSAAQQNLIEEYVAYRIFNLLSDRSFRVRLLRINYVDTDPKHTDEELQRYGFIIESEEALAERIDARRTKRESITRGSLESRQAALVYVFHYLIGNTDWSLVRADTDKYCCHNGTLFESGSDLTLVPYDFDLSGLVYARYAKPDPAVGIRSVKTRRYRGYCLPGDELSGALRTTLEKQSAILALLYDTPGFAEKEKKAASKYLEAFFEDVKDVQKTASGFDSRCL